MTRGRRPRKGLDEALPVALARGKVMSVLQTIENVCDFMIVSKDRVVLVRVRRARQIHAPVEGLEREFHEPILRLRSFPGPVPLIRELWIYSRYGTWRFFCIGDAGIVEICRDGTPMKNPFRVGARTARAIYPGKTGTKTEK